jgi:hypothetical protein
MMVSRGSHRLAIMTFRLLNILPLLYIYVYCVICTWKKRYFFVDMSKEERILTSAHPIAD